MTMIRSGRGCGHTRDGQLGRGRSVRNATRHGPPMPSLRPCHLTVTSEFRISLRWEGACLAQNNETLEFLAGTGQIAKLDSQLMVLVALLENPEIRGCSLDSFSLKTALAQQHDITTSIQRLDSVDSQTEADNSLVSPRQYIATARSALSLHSRHCSSSRPLVSCATNSSRQASRLNSGSSKESLRTLTAATSSTATSPESLGTPMEQNTTVDWNSTVVIPTTPWSRSRYPLGTDFAPCSNKERVNRGNHNVEAAYLLPMLRL